MRSVTLIPLLAALGYALPQAVSSCVTVTSEVIVPTTTVTYTSTEKTTIYATTADNLGTFTLVTTESSTKTLETLTSTSTACTSNGTITAGPTSTVYTTAGTATASTSTHKASTSTHKASTSTHKATTSSLAGPAPYFKRQTSACTVTTTFTTTYGQTYTYVAAPGETSTFTAYTAFTQATVTSTKSGGTAYRIATAVATTSAVCGPTVNATASVATSTVTQDARCAPSALVSEYSGYGLEYASDVPAAGAAWATTTDDASECCQLCAEAASCAASSWDIRTGACKLEFPVEFSTGVLNCGEGLLAYYDAGPDSPMAPGTGLYVAPLCGNVEIGSAAPDDGT
ncbi:hypothetical protein LTR36_004518 [Oleoguttula mirabilis]|uniref:Apple domain-containing protein n=1 Tax=Oleoguttula mirabilis TaxID=1507867 RepID=A0AAV9JFQ2_9PEZI|nr:hypothetical protein LTR36_004518 [Oleoguttula mirabilis]